MNDNNLQRATAREWMLAKVVVIGGLIVAVGLLAWFALKPVPSAPPPQAATAPEKLTPAQQAALDSKMDAVFCTQELSEGKAVKIVPPGAQLADQHPFKTKVAGRLACVAQTDTTRYVILADLRCNIVNSDKCVKLYGIMMGDGTVLYKRRE